MPKHRDSDLTLPSYHTKSPCKTKIACTIGPSSSSIDMLKELVCAGASLIRLNLSHCSHEFASNVIADLREHLTEIRTTCQVGVLLDLNGTKLRTGTLANHEPVHLESNEKFTFVISPLDLIGDASNVAANIPINTVCVGDQIYVDDGLLSFTVQNVICRTDYKAIECTVDFSGTLGECKGINLPNYVPDELENGLTARDVQDILFGMEQEVDFITLSCIRSETEIMEVRKLLADSRIKVLSKIENKAGLDNFQKILKYSDGIIIDRGYLGVEIDITKIAIVQREIIKQCQIVGKPVLLANQILESMKGFPRPSRSESSDVTSGVIDGADGLILSGETAIGSYPLESLQWLRKICSEAEKHVDYNEVQQAVIKAVPKPISISESIACSAVKCSQEVGAACIIIYTEAGGTARLLAKYRPTIPVVVTTNSPITARQVAVSFGVISYLHPDHGRDEEDHSLAKTLDYVKKMGIAKVGDHVVITSGHVTGFLEGTTTVMRIMTIE